MNLVVGSSGLLGGMIAHKLIDKGAKVRLLVRQPPRIGGAEAVTGDLKDRASLDAACRGVTAVITTANAAQRGGADTIESVDIAGNRSLIDAARQAGVRQFIFVSTAAADASSPVPIFAAKAKTEQHLRESGVPWTILAPLAFMDVWFGIILGSAFSAGKPVAVVAGGKTRHSFIAVDDVAEFATAAVDHPAAMNQRVVFGGPEGMSWSEIVAKTSTILGRPVPVQNVQPGQPIPTLPPPLDQAIGFLIAGLEQQNAVMDSTETARTFGVSLTPADTVLRRMFMPS